MIFRWKWVPMICALAMGGSAIGAEDGDRYSSVVIEPGQRQLFLDDFILGDIYRTTRVIHQPQKYEGNPVVRPDRPTDGSTIQLRDAPSWDKDEAVWKLWYFRMGDDGNGAGGCGYAWSKDGIHWEKPNLGLVESHGTRDNNLILVKGDPKAFIQHVILDPDAAPDQRYKGMIGPRGRKPLVSPDGFVFTPLDVPVIPSQDESHLNWDPLRKQFILTVKHDGPFGRSVYLSLSGDFKHWSDPELIYHADSRDQALGEKYIREVEGNARMWRPTIDEPREYNVEIYNMAVFPYEGLYIGMPNYFESSGRIPLPRGNQDGINSPKLACSRNLLAWTRVGDRSHFIPVSEIGPDVWDTGQILVSSHPIRRGNELWFYYSGLDVRYRPGIAQVSDEYRGAIHLAKLRVDGFVSVRAGNEAGFVETRPLILDGRRLYINATAESGRIRAEITGRDGRTALPGWGVDQCRPVSGDQSAVELRWNERDLAELRGKSVRIRFHLSNADLYSFWLER